MNKPKKRRVKKRHVALGISLLLVVGILAVVYLNKNNEGASNFFDKIKDTIPALIAQAKGENPTPEPVRVDLSTPSSSPALQETSTQPPTTPSVNTPPTTPPVQMPPVVETVACPSSSLSSGEVEKIKSTILASALVKDLPKDGVISLTFFTFCNGQRIVQNNFLIGKAQILTSGTPDIYLTLHSKYISQLSGDNLCTVIPAADANGDLGVYSDLSDTKLLMKYSGLLKYRDCLGF